MLHVLTCCSTRGTPAAAARTSPDPTPPPRPSASPAACIPPRRRIPSKQRLSHVLPPADTTTAVPVAGEDQWRELPLLKSRLAGGYCLRTAAQGVCPYTNICEHCPNFRTEPALLHVLAAQRADAHALAADAETRGWVDDAARHQQLIERLDALIGHTQVS